MLSAFTTGFILGLSLILAIGPQNAFVLRQGILREHLFYVALFCAASDAILICIGVTSVSFFFNNYAYEFKNLIFGFSAIWIASYGFMRFFSAFRSHTAIKIESLKSKKLITTLSILALLTFANPHVYLDTIILIGSISLQFNEYKKIAFAFGACLASFVFFFSLAYGAKLLTPIMQNSFSWRILDLFIAGVMFSIAVNLAKDGDLLKILNI